MQSIPIRSPYFVSSLSKVTGRYWFERHRYIVRSDARETAHETAARHLSS